MGVHVANELMIAVPSWHNEVKGPSDPVTRAFLLCLDPSVHRWRRLSVGGDR